MRLYTNKAVTILLMTVIAFGVVSCKKTDGANTGQDPKVTTLGTVEVTAQLVEIKGELPNIPLYDYAYVMKYKILKVHRGKVDSDIIYVGQYNPNKPRETVADARIAEIGGNLKSFNAGDVHRMALAVPLEDYCMAGVINKYFDEYKGPIYWAIWTNRASN